MESAKLMSMSTQWNNTMEVSLATKSHIILAKLDMKGYCLAEVKTFFILFHFRVNHRELFLY